MKTIAMNSNTTKLDPKLINLYTPLLEEGTKLKFPHDPDIYIDGQRFSIEVEVDGRPSQVPLTALYQCPLYWRRIFSDASFEMSVCRNGLELYEYLRGKTFKVVKIEKLAFKYGERTFLRNCYFYELR